MDKKTINIITIIMIIPSFIFLFLSTVIAHIYNMNPIGVGIIEALLIFSGGWAALVGQYRPKELRKNGYAKKEED